MSKKNLPAVQTQKGPSSYATPGPKDSSIVFRVVRGRVVPIRVAHPGDQNVAPTQKKGTYNYGRAAAGIGGGLAISAGSGFAAAELVKRAAKAQKESSQILKAWRAQKANPAFASSAFGHISKSKYRHAKELHALSKKAFTSRNRLLVGGALAGAAAVAWGIKGSKKRGRGRPPKYNWQEAATPLGIASTALAAGVYYKRLGRKITAQTINAIIRKVKGKATRTNFPIPTGGGKFVRFKGNKPK